MLRHPHMLSTAAKRTATEGVGFGVLAGVILLAAEIATLGSAAPLRAPASLVLGASALDSSLGTTYLAGLFVHVVLSGIFGFGYAEIEARLTDEPRHHFGFQIGLAAVYAIAVYLVNVEIIAPFFFPWLITASPWTELALMALFFGAPLGWMFAAAERHVPHHLSTWPSPARAR